MEPARDAILKALENVIDPELRRPVTELDMVRDVEIEGGDVSVTIALTVAGCPLRSSFQDQVTEHVGKVPGVERVRLGFDVMSPEEKAALTAKLRGGVSERSKGISVDRSTRVLAVASGKGGVGKSSLTVNLAAAFTQLGHRTGVLDADIYGHSIPHMLGITQRPVVVDEMIVPPVKNDLKLMSIGFFLDENSPLMWRGPMLHRALEQFLSDVHWGELDLLIVDMPPGTGDVSISLGQLLPRAEAVIVTTPQPLAQEVAVRAAIMAQKTNMRLIGVIENMTSEVFGAGGGERLAEQLGVPLLGKVPLDVQLRECGDRGEPLVWADPSPRRRGRSSRSPRRSTPGGRRSGRCRSVLKKDPHEQLRRLGFSEADAATIADHFLDCERRGKRSHGLARLGWLRKLPNLDPRRAARARLRRARVRALGRPRGRRLRDARRDLRRPAGRSAGACPGRRRLALRPDRRSRLLGQEAGRGRPRRRADRDVACCAVGSGRRSAADGDESDRDRHPQLRRQASRRGRLDGPGDPGGRARRRCLARRTSCPSAATGPTRPLHSRSGWRCSSARSRETSPEPSCSWPGPSSTRCPAYALSPPAFACPAIAETSSRIESRSESFSAQARTRSGSSAKASRKAPTASSRLPASAR